ncbi:UNVERIFIED_CONTAM: hypothetical protein K2H54_052770 [Gekko kuhli]
MIFKAETEDKFLEYAQQKALHLVSRHFETDCSRCFMEVAFGLQSKHQQDSCLRLLRSSGSAYLYFPTTERLSSKAKGKRIFNVHLVV